MPPTIAIEGLDDMVQVLLVAKLARRQQIESVGWKAAAGPATGPAGEVKLWFCSPRRALLSYAAWAVLAMRFVDGCPLNAHRVPK